MSRDWDEPLFSLRTEIRLLDRIVTGRVLRMHVGNGEAVRGNVVPMCVERMLLNMKQKTSRVR